PAEMTIDAAARTVTVTAGMRHDELTPRLHAAGFALANIASRQDVTAAGAVATGTHGSGDTVPSLAAAVTAPETIGPGGDLVPLRHDRDPEFPGAVVALGAFGIVVRLPLEIEPSYEIAQTVRVVPLDEVAADPDAVFGAAYSVSMLTGWRDDCQIWLRHR